MEFLHIIFLLALKDKLVHAIHVDGDGLGIVNVSQDFVLTLVVYPPTDFLGKSNIKCSSAYEFVLSLSVLNVDADFPFIFLEKLVIDHASDY